MFDSKKRSWTKSVTWRIIATINGVLVNYIFSHDFIQSLEVGLFANLITGVMLYYFHERAWNEVKWGKTDILERKKSDSSI